MVGNTRNKESIFKLLNLIYIMALNKMLINQCTICKARARALWKIPERVYS